jgi:CRP-like cAMP-binding protein
MFEVLRKYLERHNHVTDEEFEFIQTVFVPKHLKRGEFMLREGEIARCAAFVAQGFLRSYAVDEKGKEHIIQFAPENWWIGEKTAGETGAPSKIFIDAIEDSEVLSFDLAGHKLMIEKVPWYAAQFSAGIQRRSDAQNKRILSSLTESAEQRYYQFIEQYPNIVQRVPLQMLASYLGMTGETISRIRKKASLKK